MKIVHLKYLQNLIVAQININSIQNKFETLVSLVTFDITILIISETKIDESFPLLQIMIDWFVMLYHCDRNARGDGILEIYHWEIIKN